MFGLLGTRSVRLSLELRFGVSFTILTGKALAGCSLASLVYSRAINSPEDFSGTGIDIRDAYLFAAPPVGNRDCLLGEFESRYGYHSRLLT